MDRYPVPWLPLANFPQHMRMARLAAGKDRPLIAVIQAFDWSYYPEVLPGEKNLRPPTKAELRCMTYAALVQRATGLFYYCFHDGRWQMINHPEVWDALQEVVFEVRQRFSLFEAQHVWWPYIHRFGDNSGRFNAALESSIQPTLLRVKKGSPHVPAGDYILAVNTTERTHSYQVLLPQPNAGAVPVLEEYRSIDCKDGWLKDEFGPYAVHIYGPLKPVEPPKAAPAHSH
jgi:hypothetical protein